jgi:hypothetical protein
MTPPQCCQKRLLAALGPVLGPSKFSGIQLNFSAEFR